MSIWSRKPFDRLTIVDVSQLWAFDDSGACLGMIRGYTVKDLWRVSAFVNGQLEDVGAIYGRTQALGYLAHRGWENKHWKQETKRALERMRDDSSPNFFRRKQV